MDPKLRKDTVVALKIRYSDKQEAIYNFLNMLLLMSSCRYYLNIDMFGKNLDLARQQFLCHLQRHTATLKGHVMCQIFLDPPLWKPMVEFCQSTLAVELVKEYTEQCVVESDVI